MRNINTPFYRTDEIGRESSNCPTWLESFAEQMALTEQVKKSSAPTGPSQISSDIATAMEEILMAEQEQSGVVKRASKNAVEVARNRQESTPSIYEMMSAIVSGSKPKFSSVEEAVQDYKRRTGLSEYQRRNTAELFAEQIVQASEGEEVEDCHSTGMGGQFVGSDVGDATVSAMVECKHCGEKIPMLEKEEHMIMTHPREYMVEKGIKERKAGPNLHRSAPEVAEVEDESYTNFNPQPEPPCKQQKSEALDDVFKEFLSSIGSSKKKFF